MKPKKLEKKLTLNKVSIANLDSDKIQEIKDGLQKIKGGLHSQDPESYCASCQIGGIC